MTNIPTTFSARRRPEAAHSSESDRLKERGLVDPYIVATRWRAHRSGQRGWAQLLWPVLMLEDWLTAQDADRVAASAAAR